MPHALARTRFALVLMIAAAMTFPPASEAAPEAPFTAGTAGSALGMEPAKVVYLSNDSPLVLFDVAPRTLVRRAERLARASEAPVLVRFLAVDGLDSVHVTPYLPAASPIAEMSGKRIACGTKIAGFHECSVRPGELLALMELLSSKAETIGLRIEAEGFDGDRSLIEVMMPVGIGTDPPAQRRKRRPGT